jgi:SAM-dependent methyltransferase
MTNFKDLFSVQAKDYAKYRPNYPTQLFDYLNTLSQKKNLAWDVGTGNGQAAFELAKFFDQVIATDPSEKQIQEAAQKDNITYKVEKAESPTILDHSVNLITVAQAFHWFDHATFAKTCERVGAPGCFLAVWCYANPSINPEVDEALFHLYEGILGPYWEKERRLVEEGYVSIKMPFDGITPPEVKLEILWSLDQFLGYLKTWSALQTYLKTQDPKVIEEAFNRIRATWTPGKALPVSWRLGMRVWKIN